MRSIKTRIVLTILPIVAMAILIGVFFSFLEGFVF